jgi:hypothetical protein
MAFRPPTSTRRVFQVPPRVLTLGRVLHDLDALDGSHLWTLGILCAKGPDWELQEGADRLRLDIGPETADAFREPLWVNEGRRCAVQGALIRQSGREPFLVVERVVTGRSLGILVDQNQGH